ncbi:MAG: hypothetical protein KDI07_13450 [Anaerolineae bacterium]|nr:hypothetical protein [Anaerolineae bacterium]MCB9141379.1 hypothetical protein [Anaerolineales bacterium]MCB0236409.1 hypothetical protein [Anaerolineae bacterium]MCB0244480.1 hypothetical protein [Anaerolineae bacterium]MCB0249576.1 hypothetical protein [Anaerolineae bacterium]
MTNTAMQKPAPRRKSKTNSAVWKSGLLALSLATVVGGTTLLGQADAAQQAVAQQPAAQVLVVERQPSGELLIRQDPPTTSSFRSSTSSLNSVPTLPQRPAFRRPITRTRGS